MARATTVQCCSSKFSPELAALPTLLLPAVAGAHGFGQRFDLPLPLWLWVSGAAATLLLTFAALALFAAHCSFDSVLRSVELLRAPALRRAAHGLAQGLRGLGVALFVLTLATGWFGNPDAYANLIVTMVWVLWWVGMAFCCALLGNVWELVDPLRTCYLWATRGLPRPSLALRWPAWLGAWPAVLLFFAFAWVELVWQNKDQPRALAGVLLAYAGLSWAGMALFGVDTWRRHGDAFAIAFAVFGRFAPLELRSSAPGQPAQLRLRHFAAGLLTQERLPFSMLVFVLLMLATVSFDGFHQTPLMARIETSAQTTRWSAEALFALSALGLSETQWIGSAMLLAFALAFVLIYQACAALVQWLGGHSQHNAHAMVLTLVPIAVAYHLSHYFTLLLTSGQFIVPLASDPFGWGWNLFGTRDHKVNLGVVGPRLYWYGSVVLVVIGHVQAVVVAHIDARRRFASHQAALRSQAPMVLLMVAYTSLSLWIMAQPIVG